MTARSAALDQILIGLAESPANFAWRQKATWWLDWIEREDPDSAASDSERTRLEAALAPQSTTALAA